MAPCKKTAHLVLGFIRVGPFFHGHADDVELSSLVVEFVQERVRDYHTLVRASVDVDSGTAAINSYYLEI